MLTPEIVSKLSPIEPQDVYYMTLALDAARRGIYLTRPNPAVGCVIVKEGVVVGTGTTSKVGGAHAEVQALAQAGTQATGATVYVTLEPCSHTGRTPPCVEALIAAKVARVVVATQDSNPKVSGRGMARILAAGIVLTAFVEQQAACAINAGFLKAMATAMPYVRLKLGISLDGRVAMASGESKWVTSEQSRLDVQKLRARSAAIITGSGSILADNPALNVRMPVLGVPVADVPAPKVVVLDRRGRLSMDDDYQVFGYTDTLLWRKDLISLLKTLVAEYQCYDVLVESGAGVSAAFLSAGLVDELVVYQAPCLLGADARPMLDITFARLCDGLRLERLSHEPIGRDMKYCFRPMYVSAQKVIHN